MVRAAFLLATVALTGCSDLAEFEHELTGKDAKAWALCKEKFGNRVYSAPPYGEHTDEHILFAWVTDEAEREGGPLFCRTNGDGTQVIEVQMSKKASS